LVPGSLTAAVTVNVGPTSFYIEIIDETGQVLFTCGSGTACIVSRRDLGLPSGRS
jgi:hypothetical protein